MKVILFAIMMFFAGNAIAQEARIVEIVTVNLKEGVSVESFAPIDKAVEIEHVSKQPGFVSRQTASSDGKWLVIVYWESTEAAQASMKSFANAPAVAKFMEMIDASTMSMTRFDINR